MLVIPVSIAFVTAYNCSLDTEINEDKVCLDRYLIQVNSGIEAKVPQYPYKSMLFMDWRMVNANPSLPK